MHLEMQLRCTVIFLLSTLLKDKISLKCLAWLGFSRPLS